MPPWGTNRLCSNEPLLEQLYTSNDKYNHVLHILKEDWDILNGNTNSLDNDDENDINNNVNNDVDNNNDNENDENDIDNNT